jgi:hypothetical protein
LLAPRIALPVIRKPPTGGSEWFTFRSRTALDAGLW